MILRCIILCTVVLLCAAQELPSAVHYIIQRRGGQFAPQRLANLTFLTEQLELAESRFNLTRRAVKGNKIVRVPKENDAGGVEPDRLLGEMGRQGNWYATLKIGTPPQSIQMDLDMLTADFAVMSTTAPTGSRFEEFFSKSYVLSGEKPFTYCGYPTEQSVIPTKGKTLSLKFPHCKPAKQNLLTLRPSGSIIGLAPSDSLRQIDVPSLLQQLIDAKMVENDIFSLTLVNGQQGILSLGGTAQEAVSLIEDRIERFLGHHDSAPAAEQVDDPQQAAEDLANGAPNAGFGHDEPDQGFPPQEDKGYLKKRGLEEDAPALDAPKLMKRARPHRAERKSSWRDGWKWSPVEGAAGWWQILMRGIWADGSKVMKNQPCIIDINTPFILAPPLAAKAFYASISGSYRLPAPYSSFYAFPCNNPPFLHFEFGGWRFPVMRGMKSGDASNGPNGKFSLGKVSDDSGYCVGAIVETRMGLGDTTSIKGATRNADGTRSNSLLGEAGILAGNGMRDVWVLGEPAFRGVGMVFDMKAQEVGFRHF